MARTPDETNAYRVWRNIFVVITGGIDNPNDIYIDRAFAKYVREIFDGDEKLDAWGGWGGGSAAFTNLLYERMKQFDIPSESSDKIGVTVRVVNNNTRNLPIIQHANTVRRIPKCIIVYNLLVSTRRYAVSANDHWASRFTTTRSRSPCAYYTFAGEINPGCTRARVHVRTFFRLKSS